MGKCIVLSLLNLSMVFNTINHAILLRRSQELGRWSTLLPQFTSFLRCHFQIVLTGSETSESRFFALSCQGEISYASITLSHCLGAVEIWMGSNSIKRNALSEVPDSWRIIIFGCEWGCTAPGRSNVCSGGSHDPSLSSRKQLWPAGLCHSYNLFWLSYDGCLFLKYHSPRNRIGPPHQYVSKRP